MFFPIVQFLITVCLILLGIVVGWFYALFNHAWGGKVGVGVFVYEAVLISFLIAVIYHAPFRILFIG